MPLAVCQSVILAILAVLAAASPARAGFITYAFTSDSSDRGGALVGGFRVDAADLLDGVLSTADVRDFGFTFTDPSGAVTAYALGGVFPDLAVDPATGVPVPAAFDGMVLGDQVGGDGVVQVALALTLSVSPWLAITRPADEFDGGLGHWDIGPEANPAPAPAGAVLGPVGVACLVVARLLRRRPPHP
jgi:hypothetical protein